MERKERMMILLIVTIITVFSGLAVSGILNVTRTLSSTGTVKAINVQVFWDSDCTQIINEIDWGLIEPGENITKTIQSIASGDYSAIAEVSKEADEVDALAVGLNMLVEELVEKTVKVDYSDRRLGQVLDTIQKAAEGDFTAVDNIL